MKGNFLKLIVISCICIVLYVKGHGQSPSFQTYMNPVIPGDHPDCTVSKIGDDYYTTGSSFNVTPTIYHSTDLVHWEAIARPVSASWSGYGDTPGGGCWGGHIVFYKGKYWDFFSRANTMHFVTADQPEGPWSMPTKVNNPSQLSYGLGYDNSIFIDEDGKWYLIVKNGQPNGGIVELGDDGQATGVVYDLNWLNPSPELPYSWAEGPVMWKYKGYYYYSFARDLAGGQKVMRSTTLTADQSSWEMLGDFFNENDPLKSGSRFASPNHASNAVLIADSTSWVIHPLYAKGEWKGQGRQGLLNQVRYDANDKPTADYPVNKYFTAPKLPGSGIPWMVPKSDFFNNDQINAEWSMLGYITDDKFSLTERPGWLRISPKSSKYNTLTKNDGEHNYSLITRLEFNAVTQADEAGLIILRGDEKMLSKLSLTKNEFGHQVIRFSFDAKNFEVTNIIGNIVWLKIQRINHSITGYFSSDGVNWLQVGQGFDISAIDSYSDFSSFTGTRQGLYVQNSSAYFDLYIYRDAYTPVLAECPANQFGTVNTTLKDGIYVLDSIHNNDWALYAGVEFGNTDYPKACDSVQFIASSATTGGNIEVWLDSIDTGTKIATCHISNTGAWTTFNTFTVKTDRVTGRHDVYLKYSGSGSSRLFELKWINFIPVNSPKYISSVTSIDGSFLEARFDKHLIVPLVPEGFHVIINQNDTNAITSIVNSPNDSLSLIFYLQDTIKRDDLISLQYIPGNLLSGDNMGLVQFFDTLVVNRLPGAKPYLTKAITNKAGDSLFIAFSKKMIPPLGGFNKFQLTVNSSIEMTASSGLVNSSDSTIYILKFPSKVYYENNLVLKFNGTQIKSFDNGILDSFESLPVTNISDGYPISLTSVFMRKVNNKYTVLTLIMDKEPINFADLKEYFTVKINGTPTVIKSVNGASDSIRISFTQAIAADDTILLSYLEGPLCTKYNGKLPDIIDLPVENILTPIVSEIETNTQFVISVFPNPAHDQITVKSESGFYGLKIYSLVGTEIYSLKFSNVTRFIEFPVSLKTGIYFLDIQGINSNYITKILIE